MSSSLSCCISTMGISLAPMKGLSSAFSENISCTDLMPNLQKALYRYLLSEWIDIPGRGDGIKKGLAMSDVWGIVVMPESVIEPDLTGSWEPIVHISFQLCIQWYYLSSLESTTTDVFAPWKWANITGQSFFPLQWASLPAHPSL